MHRRSVVTSGFAMILGLAVLVEGCANSATPATTTTTTTSTTTTTTLPPTTSTTTSSTTTSTTQAGPPVTCTVGELKLVAGKGTGAAGTIYSPVEVVNTSSSACSLDGRPTVSLIGAVQGSQAAPLPATVQETGEGTVFSIAPSTLTLPPSGVVAAGFLVQSSDVPSDGEQTCPVVSSMSVTLPSVASPLSVEEAFTACGGPSISVSAIVEASALLAS
jgi:uncharacterized protein DUF4232